MSLKILSNVIKPISRTTRKVRLATENLCSKTEFTNSIFQDCSKVVKTFSDTKSASRKVSPGFFGYIKSLSKGAISAAKEAGAVPAATAAAGFCTLPVGGTSIGLITGILFKTTLKKAKNLAKLIVNKLKH